VIDLLIRNGKVVTAEKTITADVAVAKGKIAAIGKKLPVGRTEVIDARGMLVLPAAACGGVTTVVDYAIQSKGRTLEEAVTSRMADAKEKVAIDYGLHGGITDWNDRTRDELRRYARGGIPSFKMFMIYRSQGWMADDAVLFSALEETRRTGALVMLHAESAYVLDLLTERYHTPEMMKKHGAYCHTLARPDYTEYEAVQRAATWAKVTGGRVYIVHMSSAEAALAVARAKAEGVRIWAETCPQYLLLTDSVFKRKDGHLFATCPQVKKKTDSEGLLSGLKSGAVEIVSTDTCTFDTKQKGMWEGDFTKIPYGMPGVETLLPTMYTHLVRAGVSAQRVVSLLSTNPARLFGMYPKKGTIAVGSDADLVVFDPARRVTIDHQTLATRCDWSPFQGMKLTGYPHLTLSRGRVVARDGTFVGERGWGRFVERKPGGTL
jgi:dihydropyrimidinase